MTVELQVYWLSNSAILQGHGRIIHKCHTYVPEEELSDPSLQLSMSASYLLLYHQQAQTALLAVVFVSILFAKNTEIANSEINYRETSYNGFPLPFVLLHF